MAYRYKILNLKKFNELEVSRVGRIVEADLNEGEREFIKNRGLDIERVNTFRVNEFLSPVMLLNWQLEEYKNILMPSLEDVWIFEKYVTNFTKEDYEKYLYRMDNLFAYNLLKERSNSIPTPSMCRILSEDEFMNKGNFKQYTAEINIDRNKKGKACSYIKRCGYGYYSQNGLVEEKEARGDIRIMDSAKLLLSFNIIDEDGNTVYNSANMNYFYDSISNVEFFGINSVLRELERIEREKEQNDRNYIPHVYYGEIICDNKKMSEGDIHILYVIRNRLAKLTKKNGC